jgi:hypothetical protein
MAITKTSVTLLASTSVSAGTYTKSAPLSGTSIDCRSYYGGDLVYKITNGATAPTVAISITFQTSMDGTNWYDYYTASGDTVNSSIYSSTIQLDVGVMYVRIIAYANTVQPVTVEAYLQAITGV